jgi:nicotinamide mononucleotide transporter
VAALWAALYLILSRCTDSPVPLGDAFTTALSIVGMYGLAHKILHHWLLWLVADGAGAALYLWQGLHVTAVLYVIYSATAVYGFFRWRRDMKKHEQQQ